MILSPQMLWKEFDRHFMPLDTSVLTSASDNNFLNQSFYFNGGANATSNIRIYARLIEPISIATDLDYYYADSKFFENISAILADNDDTFDIYDNKYNILEDKSKTSHKNKDKECILIMPDYDQDINKIDITSFARNNASVMIVDWAGEFRNRSRYTIYPKNLSYANFDPDTFSTVLSSNPQNSCWYIWACTLLRAITFLERTGYTKIGVLGIGVGSDSVWKAASYDNSITCAACLLDSGLESFKETANSEQLNFLASMQTINYAPNINCPLFMLAESNAESGSFDKLIEEFNEINRDDKLIYILPRADSFLNDNIITDLKIWFDFYLCNIGKLPCLTYINSKKSENTLYFQLKNTSDISVTSSYIYSTQGSDSIFRFWRCSKLDSISDNEFIGKINIFDTKQQLLAYADITFSNGFCCSSPLTSLEPSFLSNIIPFKSPPRRLIFESDMGIGEFINIGSPTILKINKGYNNISGIELSGGCILTYKIGDFLYSAHGASCL